MLLDISSILVEETTGEVIGYVVENVNKPLYKCAVTAEKLKNIDPTLYEMSSKMDVLLEPVITLSDGRYALLSHEKLFLRNYESLPLERLETGDFVVYGHVIPEHDFCKLNDKTAIKRVMKGHE